jgi:hypothetical protein
VAVFAEAFIYSLRKTQVFISTTMSQPRTISYALFFPALICDLVVIAALVYPTTSAIQDGEPEIMAPSKILH